MKKKIDEKLLLEMIEQGREQKEAASILGVSPAAVCKHLAKIRKRQKINAALDILPEQQKVFVAEVVAGASQTDAARRAFNCTDGSARTIGHKLMKDERIQQSIADIMESEGISKHYLIRHLRRAIESVDDSTALKGVKIGLELHDCFPATKIKGAILHVDSPVDLSRYTD